MMYLLILGFGLSPVFQQAGQGNYIQFVAPGVVGMSVLFSSVLSGVGLLFDRQFGFLKETLVAPVPRAFIMIGRTLGSATNAVLQGTLVLTVCIIAGFRPASLAQLPLAFGFMVLIAIVFAALGTAMGSVLKDMQGFQIIMNFIVMPIFFLSGPEDPHQHRPALLRHRRPSHRTHQQLPLRRLARFHRPHHRRRGVHLPRQLSVFKDRNLASPQPHAQLPGP
jgi:ABC-2 type transport system permease protein